MKKILILLVISYSMCSLANTSGPINSKGFQYIVKTNMSLYNQKRSVEEGILLGNLKRKDIPDFPDASYEPHRYFEDFSQRESVQPSETGAMLNTAINNFVDSMFEFQVASTSGTPVEIDSYQSEDLFDCLGEVYESYKALYRLRLVGKTNETLERIVTSKRYEENGIVCWNPVIYGPSNIKSKALEFVIIENLMKTKSYDEFFLFVKKTLNNSGSSIEKEISRYALLYTNLYYKEKNKLPDNLPMFLADSLIRKGVVIDGVSSIEYEKLIGKIISKI